MKEERFIDGRRCRVYSSERYYMPNCCSGERFWVADTGDFVAYESQDDGELIPCEMGCSRSGPYIEEMGDEGYLDSIVMALFGPPQPDRDVHSRHLPMINHIDGNWMNCNINNLEWIPYHYRHSTAYREFVDYDGYNIFEVHLTGDVMLDGIELSVSSQVISRAFSNDFYLALFIDDNHAPHIKVEELMAKAGYVQGDDANLVHPVILHIDGDYRNNDTKKLEWVEATDSRYREYLDKRYQDQKAHELEMKRKNHSRPKGKINSGQIPPSASIDPITGTPIGLHIPSSAENPPAPFTPPDFSSLGEAPGVGDNPFKPI
jgi:hypothetical protein